MSYTIRTEDDAQQLLSMSRKPQYIVIAWGAGALPTKLVVSGIIHPSLTSFAATLHDMQGSKTAGLESYDDVTLATS